MRVLVTGATGFIGSAVLEQAASDSNLILRGTVRRSLIKKMDDIEIISVGNQLPNINWSEAVNDVDVIVHTAARAHVINDASTDPLVEFRRVNVDGTLNLARQAANAGVKRFIFLSSIGVNGRSNTKPFTEEDTPLPEQDYAISKLEAEMGLQEIALSSEMEIVIIRPPLVYGPNAPGNFGRLFKWMQKNIPLPFGAIRNKRSFIGLDNLVNFIITCVKHPSAANQVFLVSDDEDISTTELLNSISSAFGKKARLLPINQKLLEFLLIRLGKKGLAQQLCGSLQVDISKAKNILNWTPPVSVDEGLRKTVEHLLESPSI